MSTKGQGTRRVYLTLQSGRGPAQASDRTDFTSSVPTSSRSSVGHIQDSPAFPIGDDDLRQASVPPPFKREKRPDDPDYFDEDGDDDDIGGENGFVEPPMVSENAAENDKPFKEKFDIGELTGHKEPDHPLLQQTRQMRKSHKDYVSVSQLVEENESKKKEYLRPTAWFKSLTEPVQAFQLNDVKVNLQAVQRDCNQEKFLEHLLSDVQNIQAELRRECPERCDLLDSLVLDKVLNQLVKGEVHICVLGRTNTGKTTVVNALLEERLLPMGNLSETALNLYIEHSDVAEPELVLEEKTVNGTEGIRQFLKKQHENARDIGLHLEERCSLKLRADLLKHSTKNFKAMLVDTPGSNEVGQKKLQRLAQANVAAAAAYVYVMQYNNASAEEDYCALKAIYDWDNGIFDQEKQLTIVLTQMDKYYSEDTSENSSPEAMKKLVAKNIKDSIGTPVSPDQVYPVSGFWAVRAQEYMKSKNEKDFKHVRRAWETVCDSRPTGADEVENHHPPSLEHKLEVARKLLAESGIAKLEKRIQDVIEEQAVLGHQNILVSCKNFLDSTTRCLEVLKPKTEEEVKTSETNMIRAAGIATEQESIVESILKESPLLKKLQQEGYVEDTNYKKKAEMKVRKFVEQEKRKFLQCIKGKEYSKANLNEDLLEGMRQHGSDMIMDVILRTQFKRCQNMVNSEIRSISRKLGRAQARLNDRQTALQDLEEDPTLDESLEFEGVMQEHGVELHTFLSIDELKIHIKVQRKWFFRRIHLELVRLEKEDVDKLFEDMEDGLRKMYNKCFEDIREEVVKRFFYWYCSKVQENIVVLNRYASQELKSFKKRFEKLHGEYKEKKTFNTKIVKWLEHLKEMKEQLVSVSDKK